MIAIQRDVNATRADRCHDGCRVSHHGIYPLFYLTFYMSFDKLPWSGLVGSGRVRG